MKEFWNNRYAEPEYAYGQEPNAFLKEQLKEWRPGTILLPCEGEGRNAAYAAANGWNVQAFDLSEMAKTKAEKLATEKGVTVDFTVANAAEIEFDANRFDAVAFIYAHFPDAVRSRIHREAIRWLKPGGKLILEAFNPEQMGKNSGGPNEQSMLYTTEMLEKDFKGLDIELLETSETRLREGKYHDGDAAIIRLVGTKKIKT
ncbi:MAG: class I SAM-dependent methyltransferase [Flavobacteriales bacterium]|nr:class I SAM-dependent methyltransferase [Flavobacteriales bacterium]